MPEMLMLDAEERMEKSIESYQRELNTVRTGRANPNLLDAIRIDYYGVETPIKQISSITVPEGNQLYIKPYDKSSLKNIEAAIATSELGLPTTNDGVGIRLVIPKMTEDRRKELVKLVSKMSEEAKVAIRNIRRDLNDSLKKLELPEDDEKGYLEDSQELTDKFIKKVDEVTEEKKQEVLTI